METPYAGGSYNSIWEHGYSMGGTNSRSIVLRSEHQRTLSLPTSWRQGGGGGLPRLRMRPGCRGR